WVAPSVPVAGLCTISGRPPSPAALGDTRYRFVRLWGAHRPSCIGVGGLLVMGWTDERVETLKKLWLDGLSASQIAKHLGGVTRNAVIGKVHRLGLSGRAAPSH